MKKELDCRGLECPKPVIKTRETLQNDNPDFLEIIVDNMAAVENVSRFLNSHGYEASVNEKGPKEWRLEARRGSGGTAPESAPKIRAHEDSQKTLVLLASETLGHGDDGLGAKLMTNFIGSLGELGEALWRIILLNGGVKLAATAGPCLDSLKNLEKSGVSILVCGTCLNHYGLLEKKEVGETTNMLDVITSLALADKVIRP